MLQRPARHPWRFQTPLMSASNESTAHNRESLLPWTGATGVHSRQQKPLHQRQAQGWTRHKPRWHFWAWAHAMLVRDGQSAKGEMRGSFKRVACRLGCALPFRGRAKTSAARRSCDRHAKLLSVFRTYLAQGGLFASTTLDSRVGAMVLTFACIERPPSLYSDKRRH